MECELVFWNLINILLLVQGSTAHFQTKYMVKYEYS